MSSDPTPPDPEELTSQAPNIGDGAEAAGGGSSGGGIGSHPIVEGLLSTKPSEPAETPAELAIRGAKKFVRGALGAKIKSGQTALEDWIRAALGFYKGQQTEEATPGPTVTEAAEEPEGREEPPNKWGQQEE